MSTGCSAWPSQAAAQQVTAGRIGDEGVGERADETDEGVEGASVLEARGPGDGGDWR